MGVLNESYDEQFVGQSFTEANTRSRVFEECEFRNCSFTGAAFEDSKLINCEFIECDLSNVIIMDCQFTEVSFSKCKAIGIDWTKALKIKKLSFSECLLNYSNFRLLELPEIRMIQCDAKEVDFIETDLRGGDFKDTDFENSIFFKTNLTEADFSRAKNYSIDFTTNRLGKTRFSLPEALSLLDNADIIIE